MGQIVTQVKIKLEYEELTELQLECQQKIDALRERCTHPNATRKARSDTGNWCKADDDYWKDCSCPDCGERWVEDYTDGYGRAK